MAHSAFPDPHIFQDGEPEVPWTKLRASSPRSELHAKFWGVDIHEDEVKWLQTQPKERFMYIDEGNVAPSSFRLNLGFRYFCGSKLWVREDYIRIYDECKKYYEPQDEAEAARSVVITGQPGIGKSYWIIYAVRRRLGEKTPFLWYWHGSWYLFSESGVYEAPEHTHFGDVFYPRIWAFVDADHSSTGIPSVAVIDTLFTIFATSPRYERWQPLENVTDCLVFVMDPWTWEEISQAAVVHGLSDDQLKQAQDVFDEYGPTARLCFNYVKEKGLLSSYELHLQNRISELSIEKLLEMVTTGRDLHMDVSHVVFLIRRQHATNFQKFVLEPITRSIGRRLMVRLMDQERKSQLLAYTHMDRASGSGPLAGIVFGSMGQLQFQRRTSLKLVPMVNMRSANGKETAQWTSVPSSIASNLVPPKPISINFTPESTFEYEGSILSGFQPGVYYVPRSSKQVAFDSFIMIDQILYIFQFSIASSHPIKEHLMDFFSQPMLDTMLQGAEWRFVFIIPPGGTILCPRPSGAKFERLWERLRLFSAVFDPENMNTLEDMDEESPPPNFIDEGKGEIPIPKPPPSAPKRPSTSPPHAARPPPTKRQAGASNPGAKT